MRSEAAAMLAALLAIGASFAQARMPSDPAFPANIRLAAAARGEAAVKALGSRLPEVAAFYGKTPKQLQELLSADASLWVAANGELFYACELGCPDHAAHAATDADVSAESLNPTDPAPFDTSQAFLLHSRPGSNRVVYLDFDGHVDTTQGNWKDGAAARPYDLDGDPATFNSTERTRIIGVWQRVAEDFAMYDINVTTEDPGIEALRKTSSSDAAYGIRVCIGGSSTDWYGSGAGGVAFVGSFDAGLDVPCWVFSESIGETEKNIAEAASHEVGHTLGLYHDGVEGGAGYYSGHNYWGPIMGVSYSKAISQWSKGEYANSNNLQDDLAVMLTQGAVYRTDDHGGTQQTATRLGTDSTTASASGIIERNTDVDWFRIDAAGGPLSVQVTPSPRGANLRLEVSLLDSSGALLQTATAADTSAGTQPVLLLRSVPAGVHYVTIDGIGNGDPLTTGYSDYGSLGRYGISVGGLVPGGFTWTPTTPGSRPWSSPANWASGIVPNGSGATVRITSDTTGDQTIELTATVTLGALFIGDANSTHAFTLASAGGSIAFDNGGGGASLSKTFGGHDRVTAAVSLVDPLTVTQSASETLTFSGGLTGGGAFTKEGAGVVVFASANSYTGLTTLNDGVLRLDAADGLPGGIDAAIGTGESALVIAGGSVGLASGNFTRALGSGPGQVQWLGSGGFAAYGATRTVRFSASSLNWNATNFIGGGRVLVLGHVSADATLDWQQPISLAGSLRTIQVEDGLAPIDAILSGVVAGGSSGTSNSLTKTGEGTLALTAQNTYWGNTLVSAGTLMIGAGGTVGGVSRNSPSIVVEAGATLATNRSDPLVQGTDPLKPAITGNGGFSQVGTGNTVLMLPNAYSGPTTIESGALTLGAAGVLPDASAVYIGDASLLAGAYAESAGSLTVTGNARMEVAAGGTLSFWDSSASDWTSGELDITGSFIPGASLRFGTSATGLTPDQLERIRIGGVRQHVALDAAGYLITGYSAWRATQAPLTGSDPSADEDADGVPNALEFILGGTRDTAEGRRLPQSLLTADSLTFRFDRDQRSIGAALRIETSTDLATWQTSYDVPSAATVSTTGVSVEKDTTPGFDTVTLTLPRPSQRLFIRLVATPLTETLGRSTSTGA